ncbi:hypothetical protein JXB41_01930 [Candidatus Woesearchaeota archaeon]|nr:hypothetical protein [Candidatus Woesearchaeota archaeon]
MNEFSPQNNETYDKIQEIRRIRSAILEKLIHLEAEIDNIIAAYFISNKTRYEEFKRTILEKEFFTPAQKIRLLSDLNLHLPQDRNGIPVNLVIRLKDAFKIKNAILRSKYELHPVEINRAINVIKKFCPENISKQHSNTLYRTSLCITKNNKMEFIEFNAEFEQKFISEINDLVHEIRRIAIENNLSDKIYYYKDLYSFNIKETTN